MKSRMKAKIVGVSLLLATAIIMIAAFLLFPTHTTYMFGVIP